MDIRKDLNTLEELTQLSKNFDLNLLILFGSRAKGNFTTKSDFDFAILPPKDFSNEQQEAFFFELMKLFQTENIDLINISKTTDVKVRNEIFQSGFLVYENKQSYFSDLKARAFIDYIDFQKFRKNSLDLVKQRVTHLEA